MKPEIRIDNTVDKGRRSYRMKKLCDKLVQLSIADQPMKLLDLSNTGIAFHGSEKLQPGQYPAHLSFVLDEQTFNLNLQLNLNRIGSEYFAGEFEQLNEVDERILSRFITYCQKVLIQQAHEERLEQRRKRLEEQQAGHKS
ncbi:PilZ domain-containing protein [Nitrincola sp. MINF-07-Sa-05]|uniref:PilZ domain-containing protein n=1 Tax=Nitrincola salilacus TaxID=3400273 RepID=UPI003917D9F4